MMVGGLAAAYSVQSLSGVVSALTKTATRGQALEAPAVASKEEGQEALVEVYARRA